MCHPREGFPNEPRHQNAPLSMQILLLCRKKKTKKTPEAPGCVLTNTQRIQKRVFSPFKASCRDASANSSGSSRSFISLVMQTPDLGMGQPACPETTHYPPPSLPPIKDQKHLICCDVSRRPDSPPRAGTAGRSRSSRIAGRSHCRSASYLSPAANMAATVVWLRTVIAPPPHTRGSQIKMKALNGESRRVSAY